MKKMPMNVDYIEKGTGKTVILIHSSGAGNKQWRSLMDFLSDDYHLIAPNLFGYGATNEWINHKPQTLEDQAELIRPLIPSDGSNFSIVGHSFGGSVAMMAAKLFKDCVDKLILIEPNPFYLLKDITNAASYNEVLALHDCIKTNGASGNWELAAKVFADYWNGVGTWAAMDQIRRTKFTKVLKPNVHEWDAVLNEKTPLKDWATFLPIDTTVLRCTETVQSINDIVNLMSSEIKEWKCINYSEGGHMAPLSRPAIINPIISAALQGDG